MSLWLQVITGGHYDVDCYVEDPLGNTIYRETKKQYDSFTHQAEVKGVYQFCFSNEFSTFSHKTIYFDFQVGDEPPILPDMGNRVTALTQVSGHWPAPGWLSLSRPVSAVLSVSLSLAPLLGWKGQGRLHLFAHSVLKDTFPSEAPALSCGIPAAPCSGIPGFRLRLARSATEKRPC